MTGFKLMVPLSTSGKATSQKSQTETYPCALDAAVAAVCALPAAVVNAGAQRLLASPRSATGGRQEHTRDEAIPHLPLVTSKLRQYRDIAKQKAK
jgi:hypothetical protein